MSIFLKAVQRINPSEPDEPKKWDPVQYTTKMVDESEGKHSVNHVFSSPTSIINFTSKK